MQNLFNKIYYPTINENLTDIQISSYFDFIYYKIEILLKKMENPFFYKLRDNTEKVCIDDINQLFYFFDFYYCIDLYTSFFKFKGPHNSINSCRKFNLNYCIELYIPVDISYFSKNYIDRFNINYLKKNPKSSLLFLIFFINNKKNQLNFLNLKRYKFDLFFMNLPLITEDGTFIFDGLERVLIYQIFNNPGVYFKQEFLSSLENSYCITLICNNNSWLDITIDENDDFFILVDFTTLKVNPLKSEFFKHRFIKIKLIDLLYLFDIDFLSLLNYFRGFRIEFLNFLKKNLNIKPSTLIYNLNNIKDLFDLNDECRFLLNKYFQLNLPNYCFNLTIFDILAVINRLFIYKYYDFLEDSTDHIDNKKIKTISTFFSNLLDKNMTNIFDIKQML